MNECKPLITGCPKHVAFNPDGTLNKPLQPYCINTASPIGTVGRCRLRASELVLKASMASALEAIT